jgi:hypothetical protein
VHNGQCFFLFDELPQVLQRQATLSQLVFDGLADRIWKESPGNRDLQNQIVAKCFEFAPEAVPAAAFIGPSDFVYSNPIGISEELTTSNTGFFFAMFAIRTGKSEK